MRKFDIQIIENKRTKNDKIVRKTIRFKAKNNKKMKFSEVRQYFNYLVNEQHINPHHILILGMSDMFRTLKAFDDDDVKEYDDADYFEDKPQKEEVKDVLNNFFFVDFVLKK
jgi:hypothetical protein